MAPIRILFDYEDAATALGFKEGDTWLRRNITRLPHCKLGQYVRFTEAHLREIAAMFEVRPETHAAPTHIPAALMELRPLGARAS